MKILYSVCFFIILNILPETSAATETDSKEFCSATKREEQQCGSYTFQVVKPLLDHLRKIQGKLDNNDRQIEAKDGHIRELQLKVTELQQNLLDNVQKNIAESNTAQMAFLRESVRQLSESCQSAKCNPDLNTDKLRDCADRFENETNLIRQRDEQISNLKKEQQNMANSLKEAEEKFIDYMALFPADSCIPFAKYPGIHNIKVPGIDPFDVLCQSSETGPGWIVIQQRINGKENFYRDWNTYRNGFGLFDGDFFLGLEKIYRLTVYKRHELYIYLEEFGGKITYAIYTHFAISNAYNGYKLTNIDGYAGNTGTDDFMVYHKGQPFLTHNHDNRNECTRKLHGGWWYNNCAQTNLNGKYFDHEVNDITSIFWNDFVSLKKVQMLIRPVA